MSLPCVRYSSVGSELAAGPGSNPRTTQKFVLSKEKLLTLEDLFIAEIKPSLNTKDEFKSHTSQWKF